MKKQIIHAIKNFDISKLETLLDDKRSYMDVSKSLFLERLEKKFESARKDRCYSFDEVFFGLCNFCNKGCEGMSFYSNTGYYLDLFMEGEEEEVTDIYVCYNLSNFTGLEKIFDLGPHFCLDEKVLFQPEKEYLFIEKQYESLLQEVEELKPFIKLDAFMKWYDTYSYLRDFALNLNFSQYSDYKLYKNVSLLIKDLEGIVNLKIKSDSAIESLLSGHEATTEREQLIWLFKNKTDLYGAYNFIVPEDMSINSSVFYKSKHLEIDIDISGYEYVMDYFFKLDTCYYHMREKYRPLPQHFRQSLTVNLDSSLENFLRLHKVHLDILEKYGKNKS